MLEFTENLKSEAKTEAQSLSTCLRGDAAANYGHDVQVGCLGWKPSPSDLLKDVPVNKRILFRLKDKMSGIDIDSVWVKINGAVFRRTDPQFEYTGGRREYLISVRPDENWKYGQEINVEVYAEDLAGNPGLAVEML